MEPARHLEILRTEGDRLASGPVDSLDAVVPAMTDWTVERVLRHTGKVHRWVLTFLNEGPGGSDRTEVASLPKGADCIGAYREALDAVVARFEELDPQAPSATFTGPATVSWWMRRQAHEVSIHRTDAADAISAAGGPAPTPLASDGAADGIDEWARVLVARWSQNNTWPEDLVGRTVHIHGTDDPGPADGAEWLLTLGPDTEVKAAHAKGDVALRGRAADLLLALHRRRPLTSIDVVGDAAVAERLLDTIRL